MKRYLIWTLLSLLIISVSCKPQEAVPSPEPLPETPTETESAEAPSSYDPVAGENPWKAGVAVSRLPVYSAQFSKDGAQADHWLDVDEMQTLLKDLATKHGVEVDMIEPFVDAAGTSGFVGRIPQGQVVVLSNGEYAMRWEAVDAASKARLIKELNDPVTFFPEFLNMPDPLIPVGDFKWIYDKGSSLEQGIVNYHFWHTIVNIDEANQFYSIENRRKDLRNPLGEVRILREAEIFELAAQAKVPTFGTVFKEAYNEVELLYILDDKLWLPMYEFTLGEDSFRAYAFTDDVGEFLK